MQESDIDRAASALAWAHELALGNCLFEQLAIGERFRFKASPPGEILVKLARGYRHANGGRAWRTGSLTAVFRIPVEN